MLTQKPIPNHRLGNPKAGPAFHSHAVYEAQPTPALWRRGSAGLRSHTRYTRTRTRLANILRGLQLTENLKL